MFFDWKIKCYAKKNIRQFDGCFCFYYLCPIRI